MYSKISPFRVGISSPSLEAWQHSTNRFNRIHVPIRGAVYYDDINGNRLLKEGAMYFLINSRSQNFELLPNTDYFHFFIDFGAVPPIVSQEIFSVTLAEDPILAHLIFAAEECLFHSMETTQKLLPDGRSVSEVAKEAKRQAVAEGKTWQEVLAENGNLRNGFRVDYAKADRNPPEELEPLIGLIVRYLQRRYGISTVEHPKLDEAIRYIEKNYAEQISCDDIAQVLHLDSRYLIRLFKKNLGMPPYLYLTQRRIEHSLADLRDGLSVTETAGRCGFQSENAFRIAFKKLLGCSPTQYLKQ